MGSALGWRTAVPHPQALTRVFNKRACKIYTNILRGKAGFLMTCHKGANLLHYYVEKQAFSWHAKKGAICCIITWKQVFSWRAKNSYIWCINTWKTGFLMTPTENKVCIWCIITFCSRFFSWRDKTFKFDAILREKAGFLMTRQKVAICCIITWKSRVSHDAPKNSYIWCIYTWKSRFSHDTTEKVYIWFIISYRSRFSHGVPKTNI